MDWVTTIRDEAQRSSLLHTDSLIEHVRRKVYFNWQAMDATPTRVGQRSSLEGVYSPFGVCHIAVICGPS